MIRKYIIAGNWKMNLNATEGVELIKGLSNYAKQTDVTVVVCPPFTGLDRAGKALEGSNIQLGAQNMHTEKSGAYTGEISAEMLRHLFCGYVILGHSERRTYFAESDEFINKKVKVALANSLKPILCVGETLQEREGNKTMSVIEKQVREGLTGVTAADANDVVIAYEPIWAIGTGKTATPEMAQEVHAAIRKLLIDILGTEAANKVRILYGGSMNAANAADLLAQKDIDGGLIGGAALKADTFGKIIDAALALSK